MHPITNVKPPLCDLFPAYFKGEERVSFSFVLLEQNVCEQQVSWVNTGYVLSNTFVKNQFRGTPLQETIFYCLT